MAKSERGENRGRDRKARDESEGLISRAVSALGGGEGKGMKATDLLKEDHKRVKDLFSQYEKTEGTTTKKKQLVEEISRELDVHAQVEEKIFYQSFKKTKEEEPKKIVRESFEEHKIVKTLIAELAGMNPRDEQYDAKVIVLRESVEHHVREEEGELFPAAEEIFSDQELEQLGAEMEDFKEELERGTERSPSRPRKPGARGGPRERPAEA